MIDMEIEAQRAVRKITDHQQIVKQYQKMVRAYNILCTIIHGRAQEA